MSTTGTPPTPAELVRRLATIQMRRWVAAQVDAMLAAPDREDTAMGSYGTYHGSETVVPPEMTHDPAALAAAESAAEAAAAEWEAADRDLGALEGQARRNQSNYDRAGLQAATLREEGARARRDRTSREAEERRVTWILTGAEEELAAHAADVAQLEAAAGRALDQYAAGLGDQRHARARVERDLRASTPDLPTRLRLTSLADRYARLPTAPDPADRLARLAQAAAARWSGR